MGRVLRVSASLLAAVPCVLWLAGCGSTSTHRLPPYEAPMARTEYQTVRTTAYTHTEADHLAYTNHNALGGILHAASMPLSPGVMVATAGPVHRDAAETAEEIGGYRRVSNDIAPPPVARPVRTARAATPAAHPASAEPDDNPPWMKEYLRRRQQQGDSRQTDYITPAYLPAAAPAVYGSAAADWSRWPVGTVFRIQSTGQIYKVDDYGWALAGRNTIDLYHPTRAAMDAWGVRREPIHILQWGSREESLRLLRNHQGYKHIRRMVLELEGRGGAAAELE